jgi:hypothetical protein
MIELPADISKWRAPTWSWAAVQTEVNWTPSHREIFSSVKVTAIHYISSGPAHLGGVSDARITLYAPFIKTTLNKINEEDQLDNLWGVAVRFMGLDYDINVPGPYYVSDESDVFLLPIETRTHFAYHSALLLKQDMKTMYYERIGYVELQHGYLFDSVRLYSSEPEDEQFRMEKLEEMSGFFKSLPHKEFTIV